MQVGKLNPQTPPVASASSVSNAGKISFPGFQEILDFTSNGSESSVSVTVDGDTDKEYKIQILDLDATDPIYVFCNADEASNYGYQYIKNITGTITAARGATAGICVGAVKGITTATILTPTGFIKTECQQELVYNSGTTIDACNVWGRSWNNTASVTSLTFTTWGAGNFTAGTRITVYARRSQ